jgi:NodT family efflux transporter outer membrane factor (OMF) lipoprotein
MRRFALLPVALALAGCVVGPNYKAPEASLPPHYGETPPDLAAQPQSDLGPWWQSFGDPELDRLVALALQESPDLHVATARIAEARAQVRSARANYFPEIDATGGMNYERFSKNSGIASLASLFGGGGGSGSASGGSSAPSTGGITTPGSAIKTYSVGFDASWEIDLFGGVTRQVQAARARAESAVWNARDAELSLIAELADAYLQLRTLQERERIARAEVDRQSRSLQIMSETAKVGLVPQGDFIRQRAQLATAQAAVGPIVAQGKAEMHSIAVLIGRTPKSLIEELAVARPQLPPPPIVPPGLPADLLRRRPDVRAAERNLAAATADIGVAVADLFPKLDLTGAADLISTALGNLFSANSLQITGAAQAMFPVLDFGRRQATVSLRKAQADEAYYQYRQTVLRALKDVEDALIMMRTDSERGAVLAKGLADSQRAVQAVEARYQSGLVDFGEVLTQRQALLQNQDQLAQAQGQLRRDLLALHKALGGGWETLPIAETKPGTAASIYTEPKKKR